MKLIVCLKLLIGPVAVGFVLLSSNIDPAHKFSWDENSGWMNWLDADGGASGVVVASDHLSGYIWSENNGWINVGNGGGPYANADDTNFGVNIKGDGDLEGFGWGENIGWVNFDTSSVAPDQARFDSVIGRFRGFAWGENGGWINLDDTTHFVATECPIADPPTKPPGEAGYEKVRYISMVPGNAGYQTALRVTLTTLPAPFDGLNGTKCWVGEPQQVSENSGKIAHEPGWPDFMSANLQGSPHCMDWSTVEVLHVTDDDIIPSAVYDAQAIDCECDFESEANYSAPLTITTSAWGDLVRNCTTCPCGAPDGTVGVPTDVTAALDKFKNLRPPSIPCEAVMKARADVEPNLPDWLVNISDVTFVLDAFRGCTFSNSPPFPFCFVWAGPGGCP
ncbi:MAG: hypothetical protein JSU86_00800 [Phycisphaerales bacterium]|nr:MAG: hypothetical protein JSU86_00800 [Phycisphaerales bacterium]